MSLLKRGLDVKTRKLHPDYEAGLNAATGYLLQQIDTLDGECVSCRWIHPTGVQRGLKSLSRPYPTHNNETSPTSLGEPG